jgi:hypothetical protein
MQVFQGVAMIKHYVFLGLLTVTLALSGCAATTPLTMESRQAIRTVNVLPEVEMPDSMVYHGNAQSIGMAFGLIGSLLGFAASAGPAERFAIFMDESGIHVGQIVHAEFLDQLDQSGLFEQINSEATDAEIHLEVLMYGLMQVHGLSSRLHPQIALQTTMIDASGNVVWQKSHRVPPMGTGVPAHSAAEYVENPELLLAAMHEAAHLVVRGLLDDIRIP